MTVCSGLLNLHHRVQDVLPDLLVGPSRRADVRWGRATRRRSKRHLRVSRGQEVPVTCAPNTAFQRILVGRTEVTAHLVSSLSRESRGELVVVHVPEIKLLVVELNRCTLRPARRYVSIINLYFSLQVSLPNENGSAPRTSVISWVKYNMPVVLLSKER